MTDEPGIERRTLLRAITAASGTALSLALLSRPAAAQPSGKVAAAAFDHFETAEIGPVTTPFSSGATEGDPRCSWCMGFPEPA